MLDATLSPRSAAADLVWRGATSCWRCSNWPTQFPARHHPTLTYPRFGSSIAS